ncbi:MAG TPA: transglutaminase domain-containing protein [Candidatus Dormibacteraeota bacterium]
MIDEHTAPLGEEVEAKGSSPLGGEVAAEPPEGAAGAETLAVNPITTTLAAIASSAGAGWMAASIFRDFTAHFVALGGVVLGGGLVLASFRGRRGATFQYLVIPLSVVAGIALVAPDAQGGGSNSITGLIEQAVRSGGLLQPPISFDPGWRAVLVVLFSLLTAGAASLGVALRRPKLAVALPVPLTMGAALIQPATQEIASVVVALVLTTLAMTLAYGAELGGSGQLSAAFETRRLLRGGAIAAALGVFVVLLSSLGFLFPQPNQQHIVPPQRPPVPPLQPDRILYAYTATRNVPLRLGVIDDYDLTQNAWLLPAYDPNRIKTLRPPAKVPQPKGVKFAAGPDDVVVTIHVVDAPGHDLPSIAGLGQVKGTGQEISFDPEGQSLALTDRPVYQGLAYTLVGAPIATAAELAKTGAPPKALAYYLRAPSPPTQVVSLLDQYSQRTAKLGIPEDPFNKVQFLRVSLYQAVTVAGPGTPKDVSARRVAQMLGGSDANPYEIVAAEALLARWAGVPSRIAYGYFGGDKQSDGSYDVHPVNGSVWLEAWFDGYGWQPLTGVPPRAKPSTRPQQKNPVNITADNRIQLIVYVPVRHQTATQLFEVVDWYVLRAIPIAGLLVLLYACYPWLLKAIRRRRRQTWGRRHGLPGRIAVAYSGFRDRCRDLTIGDPAASPVAFLRYVAEDDEHAELAWLVTRSLWGDLRRDLRQEDAEAAEKLARSVARRIDRAQPGINRILARIARTSLREPFSDEVPNLWFEPRLRLEPRRRFRDWRRARRFRRLARRRGLAAAAAGLLVLVAGCGTTAKGLAPRALPKNLVPGQLGAYQFKYEPKPSRAYKLAGADALVSDGRVYSITANGVTDGAVEVSVFKPEIDVSDIDDESQIKACTDSPADCPGHEIFQGLQAEIGSARFVRVYRKNYERAYVMVLPDQRIYLWFPPHTESMVVLIVIAQAGPNTGDGLFHALLDYEHHRPIAPIPGGTT